MARAAESSSSAVWERRAIDPSQQPGAAQQIRAHRGGAPPPQIREHLFDKAVTPSDVGKLNRLVIPKQHAERCFPLDLSSNEKGLLLSFEDASGKVWRFRYSYWNSSQSYVLTKGWSRFVKEKKLDAGDIVTFERGPNQELYISWRRRASAPPSAPPHQAAIQHHHLQQQQQQQQQQHQQLRNWGSVLRHGQQQQQQQQQQAFALGSSSLISVHPWLQFSSAPVAAPRAVDQQYQRRPPAPPPPPPELSELQLQRLYGLTPRADGNIPSAARDTIPSGGGTRLFGVDLAVNNSSSSSASSSKKRALDLGSLRDDGGADIISLSLRHPEDDQSQKQQDQEQQQQPSKLQPTVPASSSSSSSGPSSKRHRTSGSNNNVDEEASSSSSGENCPDAETR